MTDTTVDPYPRRLYRNPPVVEAVARLQFVEPISWSVTTPGLIYAGLKDQYPREPQAQNEMAAELSAKEGEQPNLQLKTGASRIRFESADGTQLLIVGPDHISAHSLAPYEGWESLSNRLFEAITGLGELLPTQQFAGAGVRYINRVEVPETTFKFEEYLTIGFAGPPGFPPNVSSFFDRMESEYDDGHSRIAFTWATTESGPGTSAFLLDLDLNWFGNGNSQMDFDAASATLTQLKQRETAAFESLLQDKLRGMFDEVHD